MSVQVLVDGQGWRLNQGEAQEIDLGDTSLWMVVETWVQTGKACE